MGRQARPTLAELQGWPATVSVEQAALAFGVSRAYAYEAIKAGAFPARSIMVGRRIAILTASILSAVDPDGDVRRRETAANNRRSEARETAVLDRSSRASGHPEAA